MPQSEFSDVFVSYRRKNVEFTKQLVEALQKAGKEVWIDWEDIPPASETFSDDLKRGVEGADSFICILSPDYMESAYCIDLELGYAVELEKKIVPVVLSPFDKEGLPDKVRSINWIYFHPHAGHENTFEDALPKVLDALDTDHEQSRIGKRLLVRSLEWDTNERKRGYLLSTSELAEAENWLAKAATSTERPTDQQTDFIVASRQYHTNRRRLGMGIAAVVGVIVLALAIGALVSQQQLIASQQQLIENQLQAEQQVLEGFMTQGTIYLEAERYHDAILEFSRAIEQSPELLDAYYQRGQAYRALGGVDYSRALMDFYAAVQLDPSREDARIAHAETLDERQQWIAFAFLRAFEGDFSSLNNYDAGIVNYGFVQFSLAGGSLIDVIDRYTVRASGVVARNLATYYPRVLAKDETLRNDEAFLELLRQAAEDPIMQQVQLDVADELYRRTIYDLSINVRNIRYPLSAAMMLDIGINFGTRNSLYTKTEEELGIPTHGTLPAANGVTEAQFIRAVAELRRDEVYRLAEREGLEGLKIRPDFWDQRVEQGDWYLTGDADGTITVREGYATLDVWDPAVPFDVLNLPGTS